MINEAQDELRVMNNSANPSQVIQEVIRSKRVDGVFLQTTELV